ncbi:MAG TPA: PGPGW domain-containing protein [bacterium]|jgi:uncharacterized protein (TIGR02611 family)|nr:PGPGW domain-containing protein [bacterium]
MKKFFIALMGGTVVLIGVAMLVLPGPGTLVIAGGLAILATEFIWARRAMRNAKNAVAKIRRQSGLKEWWHRRQARAAAKPAPAIDQGVVVTRSITSLRRRNDGVHGGSK